MSVICISADEAAVKTVTSVCGGMPGFETLTVFPDAGKALAFLVDRRGSGVSRPEAFSVLWEDGVYDRSMQKQLDVIIRSMRLTLKEYGISRILDMGRGSMRILPEMLDCDLYHFQDGEEDYIRLYQGEYMSSYAWGRLTEAYMTEIKMSAPGVKAGSGRML